MSCNVAQYVPFFRLTSLFLQVVTSTQSCSPSVQIENYESFGQLSLCCGACLTGVSTLQGCLAYRGVNLTGVSALQGCLPYRGVYLTGVSALQGCLPYRGVCLTGMST